MSLTSKTLYASGMSRANAQLPTNIKCSICDRVKTAASFSKVSHDALRAIIRKEGNAAINPAGRGHVRCITCTPKQAVQKTCWDCDKTKSIEKFNLTQRKRDEGYCEQCSDIRKGIPPREESDEEDGDCDDNDDDDISSDSDASSYSDDSADTLAESARQLSIGGTNGVSSRTGGVALPGSTWNQFVETPTRSITATTNRGALVPSWDIRSETHSTTISNSSRPNSNSHAYKGSEVSNPASTRSSNAENSKPWSTKSVAGSKRNAGAHEDSPATYNSRDLQAIDQDLDNVQVESDESESD